MIYKRSYILEKEYTGSPHKGTIRTSVNKTPNNYDLRSENWKVINESRSFPDDVEIGSYLWNSCTGEPNIVSTKECLDTVHSVLGKISYHRLCLPLEVKLHLEQSDTPAKSVSEHI